jgi:hypothetical protein
MLAKEFLAFPWRDYLNVADVHIHVSYLVSSLFISIKNGKFNQTIAEVYALRLFYISS